MRGTKEGYGKATVAHVYTIARNKKIIVRTTLRINTIKAEELGTLILRTKIY